MASGLKPASAPSSLIESKTARKASVLASTTCPCSGMSSSRTALKVSRLAPDRALCCVLKLKAFTQTIDRFDENQGLQETGIGVYFKEDFDNLRDLRQRIKERFTNKKRKARRIARRTARAAEKAAEDAERNRLREPADTLSPFGYVKEEEDE